MWPASLPQLILLTKLFLKATGIQLQNSASLIFKSLNCYTIFHKKEKMYLGRYMIFAVSQPKKGRLLPAI